MKSLLLFPLFVFSLASLYSAELDTLRIYHESGGTFFFTAPDIAMQVGRFDLAAPSRVHSVSVTLNGPASDKAAVVHIFGGEGGLSVPLQEEELLAPITVRKTRAGHEQITITLQEPLPLNSSQFFIGISALDSGVTVLTDKIVRKPVCSSPEAGSYYYQALKLLNGEWRYAPFAYYIDVELSIDYQETVFSRDTAAVRSSQTSRAKAIRPTLACADINDDSYLDVLVGGRLYINDGEGRFEDQSDNIGLMSEAEYQALLDVDNDGLIDILLIGASGASLYRNGGHKNFIPRPVDFPFLPYISSINSADINNDGYLDLFIGQLSEMDSTGVGNKLLLNTGTCSFTDISHVLDRPEYTQGMCKASSFVDYNRDGYTDLYVANYYNRPDELWINNGDGTFSLADTTIGPWGGESVTSSTGCHWTDADGDGDMDALLPFYSHPLSKGAKESGSVNLLVNNHSSEQRRYAATLTAEQFFYNERSAGGAWGDINNDGRPDCIIATSCPCRYADTYLQGENQTFILSTHILGLTGLADIHDAVWADVDNNGSLDLLMVENDSLVVYRQRASSAHFIELDLRSVSGNSIGVGSTVEVHAGGKVYTQQVIAGRGRLMQDPFRIHLGLGDASTIDSVLVQWPGRKDKEVFPAVRTNAVSVLTEGQGRRRDIAGLAVANIRAYPNPAEREVTLSFEVREAGELVVEIIDLQGNVLQRLYQAQVLPGQFSVQWNGTNQAGRRVPAGAYTYSVSLNGSSFHNKVTLID